MNIGPCNRPICPHRRILTIVSGLMPGMFPAALLRVGFATAMRPILLLIAIVAAAGFLVALLVKELPLRTMSGRQVREHGRSTT
ncbi:hypothetical protein AB0395_03180 [Streptosporangium sp. NPDC051023]|uniref:hypothetical protein n=1 Tax=Streptosporangium sp. NPDC051023 TaxID=3155410 RepID=UPI00344E6ABC